MPKKYIYIHIHTYTCISLKRRSEKKELVTVFSHLQLNSQTLSFFPTLQLTFMANHLKSNGQPKDKIHTHTCKCTYLYAQLFGCIVSNLYMFMYVCMYVYVRRLPTVHVT